MNSSTPLLPTTTVRAVNASSLGQSTDIGFFSMFTYECIAQAIGYILSIPSVLLYIVECVVIIRSWKKTFNNSFYRIFLVTAFNSIFLNFFCYSLPIYRFMDMGFFNNFFNYTLPSWTPKMFLGIYTFSFGAENFLTIIVIGQRMSAILWPMDFERAWRWFLPLSLVISTIGSLGLVAPMMLMDIQLFPDRRIPELHRLMLGYYYKPGDFNSYQMTAYIIVGFFLISTAMNLSIIIAYRMHKRKRGRAKDGDPSDKLQYRLLVYTVAMFAAQTLHSLFWIFSYMYSLYPVKLRAWNNMISPHLVWIYDLRMLVFPSWFLFWASSEVQSRIKQGFKMIMLKLHKGIGLNKISKSKSTTNGPHRIKLSKGTIFERRKTLATVTN